jgi:hypothetical protein
VVAPPAPFSVTVFEKEGDFDRMLGLQEDSLKAPDIRVVERAALPGGGEFVLYNQTGDWSYRKAFATVKGSRVWLLCGAETSLDKPQGEYDTICKSLVAL